MGKKEDARMQAESLLLTFDHVEVFHNLGFASGCKRAGKRH